MAKDSIKLGDKDYALVPARLKKFREVPTETYDDGGCKGPGDPDYYGYPGQDLEDEDGRDRTPINQKPF